jgi:hypothetical protein
MTISRVARQFLCTAALVSALGGFAGAEQAFAQAFGYPPYGGPPPYGGYRDFYGPPRGYGPPPGRRAGAPFASRRAVAGLLAERGLRLEGPLDFEGPNIVAIGVDPAGRARRFVIDPYEGDVISARPLPHMAARPDGFGDESLRGELPPPPPASAARPRGPAGLSEAPPVWRTGPSPAGAPAPAARTSSVAVERHDVAPPQEKRKPVPAPAAVEASAAPARPAVAPATQGPTAAPTGELEPPRPAGGG